MESKKKFGVTNIGTVSLMMIFIVLCMVIFAVLTLSSALSDYRFNQEIALHTKEYYEASNQAEQKLQELAESLEADEEESEGTQGRVVSWQFSMNDTQELDVEIQILPGRETEDGKRYRILKWEKVNTGGWNTDNSLNLIQ